MQEMIFTYQIKMYNNLLKHCTNKVLEISCMSISMQKVILLFYEILCSLKKRLKSWKFCICSYEKKIS